MRKVFVLLFIALFIAFAWGQEHEQKLEEPLLQTPCTRRPSVSELISSINWTYAPYLQEIVMNSRPSPAPCEKGAPPNTIVGVMSAEGKGVWFRVLGQKRRYAFWPRTPLTASKHQDFRGSYEILRLWFKPTLEENDWIAVLRFRPPVKPAINLAGITEYGFHVYSRNAWVYFKPRPTEALREADFNTINYSTDSAGGLSWGEKVGLVRRYLDAVLAVIESGILEPLSMPLEPEPSRP